MRFYVNLARGNSLSPLRTVDRRLASIWLWWFLDLPGRLGCLRVQTRRVCGISHVIVLRHSSELNFFVLFANV